MIIKVSSYPKHSMILWYRRIKYCCNLNLLVSSKFLLQTRKFYSAQNRGMVCLVLSINFMLGYWAWTNSKYMQSNLSFVRLNWLQRNIHGLDTFPYVYLQSSSFFYALVGKTNCFLPLEQETTVCWFWQAAVTGHIPSTASADDNKEEFTLDFFLTWLSFRKCNN